MENTVNIDTIISICGFIIVVVGMILGFTKQSNENGRIRGMQEEKNKNFADSICRQDQEFKKHEDAEVQRNAHIDKRFNVLERKVDVISDNVQDLKNQNTK